jgi:hypothetical protein
MVYKGKVVPSLITLEHLRSLNDQGACVCHKYVMADHHDCADIIDDDCRKCIFDSYKFNPELLVEYLLSHNIITKEELFALRLEGITI